MSSNLVTDNKFTTSCSRSRVRRARIQDESGSGRRNTTLTPKGKPVQDVPAFFRANMRASVLYFPSANDAVRDTKMLVGIFD